VSATTTDRPDVEAYLAAVRSELGDLRPDERDDLLTEVEASLLDAAEESDAPIAARLGPPADFAAELRTSAGLTTAASTRRARPKRDLLANAWRSPRAASAKRVLGELAPLWWVARAYVALALLVWAADIQWSGTVPFVPTIGIGGPGSVELGAVILVLAAAASVAHGLWERRRGGPGTLSVAVNVVLALAALPLSGDLAGRLSDRTVVTSVVVQTPATPGLAVDGVPVENVYPYSREGRLMLDVLLYDQNGAPLNVRAADADASRRVLRSAAGAELFNTFPIRYFEPGTRQVAKPGATPRIAWSPVVTPALERRKPER